MRVSRVIALATAVIAAILVERIPPHHAPRLAQTIRRVAVLGDSVAHGAGDESRAGGIAGRLRAMNLGINGARTSAVLALLQRGDVRAALRATDLVVVSIGGNDLYGDNLSRFFTLLAPAHAMRRTIDRVAAIVSRIHDANPSARVVLLGLYNPYHTAFLDEQVALWDARLITRFARDRGVDVVRIADLFADTSRLSPIDHFHPSAEGYALIAARIQATW